jgi:hypothetical protein
MQLISIELNYKLPRNLWKITHIKYFSFIYDKTIFKKPLYFKHDMNKDIFQTAICKFNSFCAIIKLILLLVIIVKRCVKNSRTPNDTFLKIPLHKPRPQTWIPKFNKCVNVRLNEVKNIKQMTER